ncbi:hypothetical protein [Pseudomonas fluorescens]|uniref:hypothetical protein n=1 Tax=Pseudomonas fluorescens TaxID=294 RepID=UPI0012409097|nr:hypothetical protein [Pseudomonas fluorescens]
MERGEALSTGSWMRIESTVVGVSEQQMAPLAVVERISEQMYRATGGSVGNLIALKRDNLHELEAIERLARSLGTERFSALALQLAYEYPIKIEESYQSILKLRHSSIIGMSDAPFEALQVVCEVVISRVPELLRVLSYRYRHENRTTIPHGLWLALLELDNGDLSLIEPASPRSVNGRLPQDVVATCNDLIAKNQAMIDHEFLLACQREGLSASEAVESLIAQRRGTRDSWQDDEVEK